MNTLKEVRDPITNKLYGVYDEENCSFVQKQKGRTLRIKFPPDTQLKFLFFESEPTK